VALAILCVEYQKLKAAVVDAPLIDISATDIRERLKSGKSIEFHGGLGCERIFEAQAAASRGVIIYLVSRLSCRIPLSMSP